MEEIKLPLRARIREWKYWHIDRKTQRFFPWLARKVPTRLRYHTLINEAAAYSISHPKAEVPAINVVDIIKCMNVQDNLTK